MRLLLAFAALLPAAVCAQTAAKPPVIVDAAVHQFEDGPVISPGEGFLPGETVFFSFQIKGYSVSSEGKVLFTYRIDALDPEGVPLVEANTGRIEAEISYQDKDWQPKVRHSFLIPIHALPGRYRILAVVRDGRASVDAKAETVFGVRGRSVDTSGPLAVKDVRFFKGEEERTPLAAVVYRSGDELWTRFDITGFKAAEKNHIRVSYGISIIDPAGKVLFSVPEAAVEEDSPFYAKRYVPGMTSLTVQPKTAPGDYALLITVRDEVGGQTCESRNNFRIEQ